MLTIRPARDDDEEFLINLTPRLAEFARPAWRTADEIAQADRQILRDALLGRTDGAAVLVADMELSGGRAGYVFATTKSDYFTRESHAHVEVLAVDPAAEGRGVARALMAAVEQWARDRALGFITLNVFDGNTRARALYAGLGYEPETVHYRKALRPEAETSSRQAGQKIRIPEAMPHFIREG